MSTTQDRILERVTAARNNPGFRNSVRESTVPSEYRDIAAIKASIEDELLDNSEVRGVAIGARDHGDQAPGTPVISVFVEEDTNEQRDSINSAFRNALDRQQLAIDDSDRASDTLDIVATGRIVSRPSMPPFSLRNFLFAPILELLIGSRKLDRPLVGGLRGARASEGGEGTLGVCCYDDDPPSELIYMLSNNHVLADINNGEINDTIDLLLGSRRKRYHVGSLAGFVPIAFASTGFAPVNYVEAAIAKKFEDTVLDEQIDQIGILGGCKYDPHVHMPVQKVGASTGRLHGKVTHVDATIKVDYDNVGEARFHHQIVTDSIADDGDSGSLLVSEQGNHPIGLIFAENEDQGHIYANNIWLVENLLGIRISPNGTPPLNLGLSS